MVIKSRYKLLELKRNKQYEHQRTWNTMKNIKLLMLRLLLGVKP